ncbi:unnamed protein product, partial [Rotaria sp. Silwood2]
ELDTGTFNTIISMEDWYKLGSPVIQPSNLKLKCYSGNTLKIKGECNVKVQWTCPWEIASRSGGLVQIQSNFHNTGQILLALFFIFAKINAIFDRKIDECLMDCFVWLEQFKL